MTFNDVEITPKGGKLRYEAIIDECKVRLTTEKMCDGIKICIFPVS